MISKHGTLEGVILSTLWDLESKGVFTNSVKEVYEILNENNKEKRAYTTIKTVMDRLHEKKLLLRYKQGRKFFYRTTHSKIEIVTNSLNEIANRYCSGNIAELSDILHVNNPKSLIGA